MGISASEDILTRGEEKIINKGLLSDQYYTEFKAFIQTK